MAGTIRGSINHYVNSGSDNNNGIDCFAGIARFFDSQMTRIASNAGVVGAGSAGTNTILGFSGDANYSNYQQYGVWRWDRVDGIKLYLLLQYYNTGQSLGTLTPFSSAQDATGAFGISLSMAYDTSGGNPWKGGMANVGTDVKGSPVWGTDGGDLICFPRQNSIGGSFESLKQGSSFIIGINTGQPHKYHVMMDDDALWIAHSRNNANEHLERMYFGPYIPLTGVNPVNPLVWMNITNLNANISWTALFGNTAYQAEYGGGVVSPLLSGVRSVICSTISYLPDTTFQPNPLTSSYDVIPWYLRTSDLIYPKESSNLGYIDANMLGCLGNVNPNSRSSDLLKLVVGSATTSHFKWLFPWDGASDPTSTAAGRAGIQF